MLKITKIEPSGEAVAKAKQLLEEFENERGRNTIMSLRGTMPDKLDFEVYNSVLYRLAMSFDLEQTWQKL